MKKIALLLAIVMLFSAFTFSAFAAEDAVVSISSVTAKANDQITVKVSAKNAPAMVGAQLSIRYDTQAMSFVSAKCLNNHFGAFYPSSEQGADPVKLVFANLSLTETSGSFDMAEITFQLSPNAADSRYTLGLTVEEAYNANLDAVALKAENGTVTVGNPPAASTVIKMTLGKTDYTVNGEAKTMDVAPIIRNDRTMLPVRYVAEALGAEILWDGATSTATLKTAVTEIKITVGATTALVNGQSVTLDSPAFIENSRTYMPVRFVAETLGATVGWDGATSTATISK